MACFGNSNFLTFFLVLDYGSGFSVWSFLSFSRYCTRSCLTMKAGVGVAHKLFKQVAQRVQYAKVKSHLKKKTVNGPWKPEAQNRTLPSFYACPGYQQL